MRYIVVISVEGQSPEGDPYGHPSEWDWTELVGEGTRVLAVVENA